MGVAVGVLSRKDIDIIARINSEAAGSAGIADMTTIGARIRNGCIGRFGNTRAEQVSPPAEPPPANTLYRLVWSAWFVSPSPLASSPPCCGALNCSIRRAIIPEGTAALVGRGDEDLPYEI